MALSNWETLAVNAKGEPINGVFVSKLGVSVEFYKNWLYVRDPKGWLEGGHFIEPTVMKVESCELAYKDVRIIAKRGPQDGIYAVIYSQRFERVPEGGCTACGKQDKVHKYGTHGELELPFHASDCPVVFDCMVGIGCYGYEDREFVGVKAESVEFLKAWLNTSSQEVMELRNERGEVEHRSEYTDYAFEEAFRKIPLEKPLRFNQGDAYFSKRLDFDLPATEPGAQQDTVLSQMLKRKE